MAGYGYVVFGLSSPLLSYFEVSLPGAMVAAMGGHQLLGALRNANVAYVVIWRSEGTISDVVLWFARRVD